MVIFKKLNAIVIMVTLCFFFTPSVHADNILFNDNFDKYSVGVAPEQLGNWSFAFIGSDEPNFKTSWEIVEHNGGKALCAKYRGASESAAIALISTAESNKWTDYCMNFDITVKKNYVVTYNKFSFAVPYRIQDINKGNAFIACNLTSSGQIISDNNLGDYWHTGVENNTLKADPLNATINVMIKVKGNTAEFYKNGNLYLSKTLDNLSQQGTAGIAMVNGYTYGFEAIVDNVIVKTLPDTAPLLTKGEGNSVNYSLPPGLNGMLIISQYGSANRLLSCDISYVSNSGTKQYVPEGQRGKAFLWKVLDNEEQITPLCSYLDL